MKPTVNEELVDDFLEVLQSDVFKAMFDATRIQIVLSLFADGPNNVSEVAQRFEQDRSVISRHLQLLERAGVICSRRVSREVRYEIDHDGFPEIQEMVNRISTLLARCCG